jgi:hypothetical protein
LVGTHLAAFDACEVCAQRTALSNSCARRVALTRRLREQSHIALRGECIGNHVFVLGSLVSAASLRFGVGLRAFAHLCNFFTIAFATKKMREDVRLLDEEVESSRPFDLLRDRVRSRKPHKQRA